MATEREMELAKQILEKVTAMEERVTKLGDSVKELKTEYIEVHTGLQAVFEQGFADVHRELDAISEINKNRRSAKEIVEGIAGNGQIK
ncbi:Uncharacterized protein BWINRASL_05346 [Bacillus mycoides]|nr:Uncharacterized protein BWINRASL_05346 [Bacillus mycoides]